MQSSWTNLSSRVRLTEDRVACPPFLAHGLSEALIPDHVSVPCEYFGARVATLEVFFLAPIVPDADEEGIILTPSTSNDGNAVIERLPPAMAIEHHFYSSKCKSSFDFSVALELSTPQQLQNRRRVLIPDFKWLLPHLKPAELDPTFWASCRLSERHSRYPTMVVGSNQWRAFIIASLQQWVSDSLVVKFHDAFVDSVTSICSRMSFEYNTCLCGIGDTACAPFSNRDPPALRRRGDLPRELHENRVIFSVREATASNSLFSVGISIPLLLTEKANVEKKIRVWVDLYLKLKQFPPLSRPLSMECTFTLFLCCDVASTTFKVLKEAFHSWLSLDDNKPIAFDAAPSHACPPEMSTCAWWLDFLADTVDFSGIAWDAADDAKRSSSPTLVEAPVSVASTCPKGPRFGGGGPGNTQTLMDFIPSLEDYLLDFCLREPGHFLELCNALSQSLGLPAELNPRCVQPSGQRATRSAMYHVLDEATELAVWVFIQYEGVMRMPLVTVGSFQVTLPSERPIKVKANISPSGLKADSRGNFFDVVLMADAIQAAVCQRVSDIYSIVRFPVTEPVNDAATAPPATSPSPLSDNDDASLQVSNIDDTALPVARHTDPMEGVMDSGTVAQEKSWFSPSPHGCPSPCACVDEVTEDVVAAPDNRETLPEGTSDQQTPAVTDER